MWSTPECQTRAIPNSEPGPTLRMHTIVLQLGGHPMWAIPGAWQPSAWELPASSNGAAWGTWMHCRGQDIQHGKPMLGSCPMLYMGQFLLSHVAYHVG
jgi:hypothetical protein